MQPGKALSVLNFNWTRTRTERGMGNSLLISIIRMRRERGIFEFPCQRIHLGNSKSALILIPTHFRVVT